jgi:poly(hydroxyalkanoate) granule-associated protein
VRGKERIMAVKKKGKLGGASKPAEPGKAPGGPLYSAQQIWSAGLGAMSRAQEGGNKFFDELVREGARLQGGALTTAQKVVMQAFEGAQKKVNRRVDDVRDTANETWDNLEKIFQTRVQRALHQLGMPTAEEIGELTRKVHQLTHSVEKLAAARAGASKPKKAKTTKKAPAKRSRTARRTAPKSGVTSPGGT